MSTTSTSAIPIVLVSGFLGAGKTTLMERLIRSAHGRGLRACVIVNEFGEADVDGGILAAGSAELLASVAGGCACCSGADEFLWTLLEVANRTGATRPDVILIECSGLADPLLMLDSITSARLLPLVRLGVLLCVADRGRFFLARDEVLPLLSRQLQLADFVILNKIDADGPPLDEMEAQLKHVAPHAQVLRARRADIDFETLWPRVLSPSTSAPTLRDEPRESSHARFQTAYCPLPHPIEAAWLRSAVGSLGPEVWRAKGFVRLRGEATLHLLQMTLGRRGPTVELRPFALFKPGSASEPATGLVFIGPSLDREALRRRFAGAAVGW